MFTMPYNCHSRVTKGGGMKTGPLQSGTKIQLQKDAEAQAGATERQVTISGDAHRVEYSIQLIQAKIQEVRLLLLPPGSACSQFLWPVSLVVRC